MSAMPHSNELVDSWCAAFAGTCVPDSTSEIMAVCRAALLDVSQAGHSPESSIIMSRWCGILESVMLDSNDSIMKMFKTAMTHVTDEAAYSICVLPSRMHMIVAVNPPTSAPPVKVRRWPYKGYDKTNPRWPFEGYGWTGMQNYIVAVPDIGTPSISGSRRPEPVVHIKSPHSVRTRYHLSKECSIVGMGVGLRSMPLTQAVAFGLHVCRVCDTKSVRRSIAPGTLKRKFDIPIDYDTTVSSSTRSASASITNPASPARRPLMTPEEDSSSD